MRRRSARVDSNQNTPLAPTVVPGLLFFASPRRLDAQRHFAVQNRPEEKGNNWMRIHAVPPGTREHLEGSSEAKSVFAPVVPPARPLQTLASQSG